MLKKNLTRKDLSAAIYQNLGFSKNLSLTIIDDCFDFLISELVKSNKIKISSFGTFEVIKKNERIGRNPKTKIETKISARKVLRFIPSTSIKKRLNNL
ncbi:HU family DNA-binding protein [Pelagibacteraceae bacterium]|nr:HU family DNA-binding protein [Pelagibacteraceae bacterium]